MHGTPGPAEPPRKRHHLRKWLLITAAALTVVLFVGDFATTHGWLFDPACQDSYPLIAAPSAVRPLAIGKAVPVTANGRRAASIAITSVRVTTWPDPASSEHLAPQNGYYVIARVTITVSPQYTAFFAGAEDFLAFADSKEYSEGNGNSYDAVDDTNAWLDPNITPSLGAGKTGSGLIMFDMPAPHGKIAYSPNCDRPSIAEWSYCGALCRLMCLLTPRYRVR